MHETGVIKEILAAMESVSRDHAGQAIKLARIEISEFGGFDAHHFQEHFEEEARGTRWQKVGLEITRVPTGEPARLVSVTFGGDEA